MDYSEPLSLPGYLLPDLKPVFEWKSYLIFHFIIFVTIFPILSVIQAESVNPACSLPFLGSDPLSEPFIPIASALD